VIDLQPLLAAAAPADLLPARRADEAQRVELPWTIVASVEVGLADPANEGAYQYLSGFCVQPSATR
jgi:hypothetical protein